MASNAIMICKNVFKGDDTDKRKEQFNKKIADIVNHYFRTKDN